MISEKKKKRKKEKKKETCHSLSFRSPHTPIFSFLCVTPSARAHLRLPATASPPTCNARPRRDRHSSPSGRLSSGSSRRTSLQVEREFCRRPSSQPPPFYHPSLAQTAFQPLPAVNRRE